MTLSDRFLGSSLCALLAILLCLESAAAEPEILYSQELAPFPTPIVVPVAIDGRRYTFYFDTGTAPQVFDLSLKKLVSGTGEKRPTRFTTQVAELEYYRAPRIWMGPWEVAPGTVVLADLSAVRLADGRNIPGLVGFDGFQGTCISLDYDRRLFSVTKSLPESSAGMVPLAFNRSPSGVIKSELTMRLADRDITFSIDTGYNGGIGLKHDTFMHFQDWGIVEKVETFSAAVGGEGAHSSNVGRFTQGRLLGMPLKGVRVTDTGLVNIIGLEILVNFNLLFDLDSGTFWYQARKCEPPIVPSGSLGAIVIFPNGKPTVFKLLPGGPAALAGIQEGDEIVALGGVPGEELNIVSLYQFCVEHAGQTAEVKFTRSGAGITTVHLDVKPDQWALPVKALQR